MFQFRRQAHLAYGARMNLDKKSGLTPSYNQKVQKIVQKFKSSTLGPFYSRKMIQM